MKKFTVKLKHIIERYELVIENVISVIKTFEGFEIESLDFDKPIRTNNEIFSASIINV